MRGLYAAYKMAHLSQLEKSVSVMRKELKNLRKQMESLRYMLKSEIQYIKRKVTEAHKPLDSPPQPVCAEDKACEKRSPLITSFTNTAIGTVRTCFREKNGTPRQPGLCANATGVIRLETTSSGINPRHALEGLEEYSHAWLLFVFHCNENSSIKSKVKPPRLGGEKRGVFATRSPHRPCPVGLSLVQVNKVVGDTVYVSGVDLIDGTPILDIKPYIPAYDDPTMHMDSMNTAHTYDKETHCQLGSLVRVAPWLYSPPVTKLQVEFTSNAEHQLALFQCSESVSVSQENPLQNHDKSVGREFEPSLCESSDYLLQTFSSLSDARQAIVAVLQQDPRSVYRREKCLLETYKFSIDNLNISCQFTDEKAVVIDIQPKTQWIHK